MLRKADGEPRGFKLTLVPPTDSLEFMSIIFNGWYDRNKNDLTTREALRSHYARWSTLEALPCTFTAYRDFYVSACTVDFIGSRASNDMQTSAYSLARPSTDNMVRKYNFSLIGRLTETPVPSPLLWMTRPPRRSSPTLRPRIVIPMTPNPLPQGKLTPMPPPMPHRKVNVSGLWNPIATLRRKQLY